MDAAEVHNQELINKVNLAVNYLNSNAIDEALELFISLNQEVPNNWQILYNIGNCYLYKKKLVEAIQFYKNSLIQNENNPQALNNMGLCFTWQKQLTSGKSYFHKAIELAPDYFDAMLNLANIYYQEKNFPKAEQLLQKAKSLGQERSEIYYLLSDIYEQQNKFSEAISCLKKLPNNNQNINYKLADLYKKNKHYSAAINIYQQLLAEGNTSLEVINNLASCLGETKQYQAAKELLLNCIDTNPSYNLAKINLSILALNQGDYQLAIKYATLALEDEPYNIQYLLVLAAAYQNNNQIIEARETLMEAASYVPDDMQIYLRLATILYDLRDYTNTKLLSDKVIKKDPTNLEALALYLTAAIDCADWSNFHQRGNLFMQALKDKLQQQLLIQEPIFTTLYLNNDSKLQKKLAQNYATNFKTDYKFPVKSFNTKLKIGYLSADFNNHPVGFLLYDQLKYHNRDKFSIYAYYTNDVTDKITTTIEQSVDVFRDISELDYRQAAEVIFADDIDILIDLTGYTKHNKTQILSYQPAKAQVHCIGYPGTMGCDFIDYHLTTTTISPPESVDSYSEQLVYLPTTIMARDSLATTFPEANKKQFNLPEDKFIFCYHGRTGRITEEVFNCWLTILQNTDSVLWLSEDSKEAIENLYQAAIKANINLERIIFSPKTNLSSNWSHRLANVWLDTFVLTAGTSTVLSIWADLPLLTHMGETPQSRTSASYLKACNLHELIAQNHTDYINKAIKLCNDQEYYQQIKQFIQNNKSNFPIYNGQQFIEDLEHAYQLIAIDKATHRQQKTIYVK